MRHYDSGLFQQATYDERGIFHEGRGAELRLLRRAGGLDPSVGRVFEGHMNGVLLVNLYGTPEQRERVAAEVRAGHTLGVWNAQASEPTRIRRTGEQLIFTGTKTWASGAGSITRPIVTAAWPDGSAQMCLMPIEKVPVVIDSSGWRPLGMHDSDSFTVSFDEVRLDEEDLLGSPGDYERSPWFLGGALRFVAVHTGILERLFDETVDYLTRNGREPDALQRARISLMRIGLFSALNWLDAGVKAWETFDRDPSASQATCVDDIVDMARCAVETISLDSIALSMRCVGANGLLEPLALPGLIRASLRCIYVSRRPTRPCYASRQMRLARPVCAPAALRRGSVA